MKTLKIQKSLKMLFVLLSVGVLATGCFESDAENAIEDMGEGIERTAEKAKDGVEDAGDKIEDRVDDLN